MMFFKGICDPQRMSFSDSFLQCQSEFEQITVPCYCNKSSSSPKTAAEKTFSSKWTNAFKIFHFGVKTLCTNNSSFYSNAEPLLVKVKAQEQNTTELKLTYAIILYIILYSVEPLHRSMCCQL